MLQKFERIEKHLYRRQYQTAKGEVTMTYYARLKTGGGNSANFPSEANSKPPGRAWKNTEFGYFRHRVGPRHVSANYMPKDFADNSATQKRIALSISVFKRPAPLSSNSS